MESVWHHATTQRKGLPVVEEGYKGLYLPLAGMNGPLKEQQRTMGINKISTRVTLKEHSLAVPCGMSCATNRSRM